MIAITYHSWKFLKLEARPQGWTFLPVHWTVFSALEWTIVREGHEYYLLRTWGAFWRHRKHICQVTNDGVSLSKVSAAEQRARCVFVIQPGCTSDHVVNKNCEETSLRMLKILVFWIFYSALQRCGQWPVHLLRPLQEPALQLGSNHPRPDVQTLLVPHRSLLLRLHKS